MLEVNETWIYFEFAILRREDGVCTQSAVLTGNLKCEVVPSDVADRVKAVLMRAVGDWFAALDSEEREGLFDETCDTFNIFDLDIYWDDDLERRLMKLGIADFLIKVVDVCDTWECDDILLSKNSD